MAASLGVASIGALASLAVYRNYFITLALLALGYSFFLTLRKKYRAGLGFRNYRFGRDDIVLLTITILVIWGVLFPYIRGVIPGQVGASYDARGSVVEINANGKKVTLQHEEIKGLMPAMTMEFSVKSPELLDGVHPSDRVRFTLSPQGADFVVEKIVKEEKEGSK